MSNDPWADVPPPITARQVSRVVGLIADYTAAEAEELISSLSSGRPCAACGQYGSGQHSRTCPTQGDRS